MTGRLTIRGIDEADLDILKASARAQGTSLNRYVTDVLHQQAQREHHRQLFAAVAAQQRDLPPFDSVAEVRAVRDAWERRPGCSPSHHRQPGDTDNADRAD